jgi:Xaa-Pro aminopeptidase
VTADPAAPATAIAPATASAPVTATAPATAARRDALRSRLRAEGLAALLVTKLVNLRYLTGFSGTAGRALVTADGGGDVLATDGRYLERAAQEAPGLPLVDSRGTEWLAERLDPGARLGVESHDLPWDAARALVAALPGRAVVPAPAHVEGLRQRKDDAELAAIARACAVGDEAFAALLSWLAPGLTEQQVARRLERELVDRGADAPAFPSIVASGPNGARPHHEPGDRPLVRGDLVTLDYGARIAGYASDMTRTVALGRPAAELAAVYELVREAQAAGVAAVGDGVAAGAVDAACRDRIAAGGRADAFLHPTGHALGLEIHEEPILRAGATATLANRMAVTVEPGVYLAGLGGVRIEDTVVIGTPPAHGGVRLLTRSPRDLLVL